MGTLLETVVALGILATVAGVTLQAGAMATHAAANAALRAVLQDAAERELRVALDVVKYQGGSLAPATIATALPLQAAPPLPVRLSLAATAQSNGAIVVTVSAAPIDDPSQRVSANATLDRRAPLPGAVVRAPGLAPAPTGAP